MHKMIKKNPEKKIVDQYVLELTYNRECGKTDISKPYLYVKHFDYVDYFINSEGNNYIRAQNLEPFVLLQQEGKSYIFQGKDGRLEFFEKQGDAIAWKKTDRSKGNKWQALINQAQNTWIKTKEKFF